LHKSSESTLHRFIPRLPQGWRIHYQHDLGTNLAGAALALDLMDEIEGLRAKLGRFE
jgi:hypothetical protein